MNFIILQLLSSTMHVVVNFLCFVLCSIRPAYLFPENACSFAHNEARNLHINTPFLRWATALAIEAQARANAVVSSSNPIIQQVGENIYRDVSALSAPSKTCGDAVKSW